MNKSKLDPSAKLIHRIYFTNFAPFHDPYEHYLETWHKQLPEYKVMQWNMSNLDVQENAWTKKAFEQKAPVFLSEYFRWKLLYEQGGLYLDADCEVINGQVLNKIIEELHSQNEYDVFFGVEERKNGHPTAQTFGAKKGSELARYMMNMYANHLAPLWHWRETRGLIGPQLMALYFLEKQINVASNGFFTDLTAPVVAGRAKVYPQTYFSPKFTLMGETLDFDKDKTCVYHLFANSNLDFSKNKREEKTRKLALKFSEFREEVSKRALFPRYYDGSHLSTQVGKHTDTGIASTGVDGILLFGPYVSLPRGDYVAKLVCKALPKQGQGKLAITAETGKTVLASQKFTFSAKGGTEIEVPFSVLTDEAYAIEFVFSTEGVGAIEIQGVSVAQRKAHGQLAVPIASNGQKQVPIKGSLKILHRVYFGFDGKPDMFMKYLDTWQEQLPDFQIMKWDATNLPMDINPYVVKLYAEKDHAFLTDFFRWYLLREYGGSYLDADVELVNGAIYRQLIGELEESTVFDAFIGIDERDGGWYTAHSMASKPNSDLANFMCDLYTNFGSFAAWRKKGFYFWAPQLVALYFANKGHNVAGMGTSPKLDGPVVTANVKIYPQDWFSPLSPTGNASAPFALNGNSENTSLCHHFACSWHDADSLYLDHSKKHGGQASVLLRDLLAAGRTQRFSVASGAMQTLAGTNLRHVIATKGTSGFLAYGPYAALQRGAYAATFHLKNVRSVAETTIDAATNFGNDILVSKKLTASDVRENKVTIYFRAERMLDRVEFRIQVGTASDFEFAEIELRQS